jgi:hypothetical protein
LTTPEKPPTVEADDDAGAAAVFFGVKVFVKTVIPAFTRLFASPVNHSFEPNFTSAI